MTPPDPPRGPDVRLAVFPEHRYALVQFQGPVTGHEILTAGADIVHHPDWRPGFTEVWDVRAASVSVSPSDIKALGEAEKAWKDLLAGSVTIVVVDRPAIRYSLEFYAQMVKPLGRQILVSRTAEDAAVALGIDRLPVLPEAD